MNTLPKSLTRGLAEADHDRTCSVDQALVLACRHTGPTGVCLGVVLEQLIIYVHYSVNGWWSNRRNVVHLIILFWFYLY